MLKRPLLAALRRSRLNNARVSKYPGLAFITCQPAYAILLVIAIAVSLLSDVKSVYQAYVASKEWRVVTGSVVSRSFTPDCWWRPGLSKLDIEYVYAIDGRTYRSRKISFSHDACGSSEDAKAVGDVSSPSIYLSVYYDPDEPSRSVLVRGFYGDSRYVFVAMFVLQWVCLVYLMRSRRRSKADKFREMRRNIRLVRQKMKQKGR